MENKMGNNEILITSLILKKTLNFLLKENEGIIIKIENKMKPMFPNINKVIVFKDNNNEIKIIDYDTELDDGQLIEIEFKNK